MGGGVAPVDSANDMTMDERAPTPLPGATTTTANPFSDMATTTNPTPAHLDLDAVTNPGANPFQVQQPGVMTNPEAFPVDTPSPSSGGAHAFPVGLRVLVVDDDPICLMIVEKMLRRCDYQVTTCKSGQTALEMLRANKEDPPFDIVLTDVNMPGIDGFLLLQ